MSKLILLCVLLLATLAVGPSARAQSDEASRPSPPEIKQPDYRHADSAKSTHGRWDHQYWLFTPADPAPAAAPVVLFFHGWMQINPVGYGAWLDHLVRQGHIVIYPRYQGGPLTDPSRFLDNASVAIRDALDRLTQAESRVKPDLSRVIAVGHSMGGLLAVNYAARAQTMDLPQPLAVYSLQPGKSNLMPLADLATLPMHLELLAITGDIDRITGDADARAIIQQATALPDHQRALIEFRTDRHGSPGIYASHGSPLARHDGYSADELAKAAGEKADIFLAGQTFWAGEPDLLDRRGYWALLDLLMDRALARSTDAAGPEIMLSLPDAISDLSLGQWSDGQPIRTPLVIRADELAEGQRVSEQRER